MFTVHLEKDKGIQAKQVLPFYVETFKKATQNFKVLEQTYHDHKNHSQGSLAMVYKNNNRSEIVYMRYYSGPYDLVGVQYATTVKDDEDPKKVLSELKAFVDEHSKIVFIK